MSLVLSITKAPEAYSTLETVPGFRRGGVAVIPPPTMNTLVLDNVSSPGLGGFIQATATTTGADSVTYQWNRDTVPIVGETASGYSCVRADVAKVITCTGVAHGPGGTSDPLISNETNPIRGTPLNTTEPVLNSTGDFLIPDVNDVLGCGTGVWSAYPEPVYTYLWYATTVPDALFGNAPRNINYEATYTVGNDASPDAGQFLGCVVTATNSEGNASANGHGGLYDFHTTGQVISP